MVPLALLLKLPTWVGLGKNLVGFVFEHWKPILVLLMVATIYYQNFIRTQYVFGLDTLPSIRAEVEKYKKAAEEAVEANKTLTETIKSRNDEVEKWKNVSKKLEKDRTKLQGELNEIRKSTNKQVSDTLNDPTPSTSEEAIEYLRKGIDDL